MRAWSQMFNAFLASRDDVRPYTDEDYFAYVDGKPRYEGVASFLASRSIELPYGEAGDDPAIESVSGLGNRKNEVFNQVLARDGIAPYPGSLRLVRALQAAGIPMAVVSSSRNAQAVLAASDLAQYFEVVVDGNVADELALPGKPKPQTFLHAAWQLQIAPEKCAVLEDAISGVQAARAGAFGLVIGVNRGAGVGELSAAGAHLVVSDCAELLP